VYIINSLKKHNDILINNSR